MHVSLHTAEVRGREHLPGRRGPLGRAVRRHAAEPKCDDGEPINTIVFERDLGSVRVPPFVALFGSSILFILSLLGLHWRERDLQEQAAARAGRGRPGDEAPRLERTPEKV